MQQNRQGQSSTARKRLAQTAFGSNLELMPITGFGRGRGDGGKCQRRAVLREDGQQPQRSSGRGRYSGKATTATSPSKLHPVQKGSTVPPVPQNYGKHRIQYSHSDNLKPKRTLPGPSCSRMQEDVSKARFSSGFLGVPNHGNQWSQQPYYQPAGIWRPGDCDPRYYNHPMEIMDPAAVPYQGDSYCYGGDVSVTCYPSLASSVPYPSPYQPGPSGDHSVQWVVQEGSQPPENPRDEKKPPTQTSVKTDKPKKSASEDVDKSLHVVTCNIRGLQHWNKFKDRIQTIFEVYGFLDSAIQRNSTGGSREFLLRDETKASVKCIFFEIDRLLPKLTRGQWQRCMGTLDTKSGMLKCASVRPASDAERKLAPLLYRVSNQTMRSLTENLRES